MDGFLFIDKPKGPSSFEIIKRARRALGIKKIGHNGTLDPCASGLLVLAVGNATRMLPFVPSEPKVYSFSIQFGKTTDTLDEAGIVCEEGWPSPSLEALCAAIKQFTGTIQQTPPHHSAIKIDGIRAYKRARAQETFTMPQRTVTVYSLDLLHYDQVASQAHLRASCSKGTYIRSLVRDIALNAGSVGYATAIRREAVNGFTTEHAASEEDLREHASDHIRSIAETLAALPSCVATGRQLSLLASGRDITLEISDSPSMLFVYNTDNELVAITQKVVCGLYHPIKVFTKP